MFDTVYQVAGGPAGGGWDERVDRTAFDRTLGQMPDVHFLINHEGRSLARTKSGTLRLSTDSTGLLSEARVDRRTRDGQDLEISMERGDLDEMSMGFRTLQHTWEGDLRTLMQVDLNKGDVSVVNNGANPATRIALVPALEALSRMSADEFRSLDNPLDKLREARSHLDDLIAEVSPPTPGLLSVDQALAILEGRA